MKSLSMLAAALALASFALPARVLAQPQPSSEDWHFLHQNQDGTRMYASDARPRLQTATILGSLLLDIAKPTASTIDTQSRQRVRSAHSIIEFDCARQSLRTLRVIEHAGPMGTGAIVAQRDLSAPWTPVRGAPDPQARLLDLIQAAMAKVYCSPAATASAQTPNTPHKSCRMVTVQQGGVSPGRESTDAPRVSDVVVERCD